MLPSALGRGEGGEFRAPISIATIGGLITSTGLTLIVVPVAYLLLSRFLRWFKVTKQQPSPAIHTAVRVTSVVIIIALLGWFVSAPAAFGQDLSAHSAGEKPAPTTAALELTFDQALAQAMKNNEALRTFNIDAV
jgi:AcrB/AcrD/AcrF family